MLKKINQNEMAKRITLKEGKKSSLHIGNVKEVMKLHLIELAQFQDEQVLKLLKRYKNK